jgi:Hint domain-containing protein
MSFTPNTEITTKRGQVAVQDLRAGDMVKTRDNGFQEIIWVGKKNISGRELLNAPHLRPVMILKDAFGDGAPNADMMITPNLRVLVAKDRTSLLLPSKTGLVAAKNLVDNLDILHVECVGTQFIQLRFAKHQTISANGLWVENFDCEDLSLGGIGNAQRNEVFELFPELRRYTNAAHAMNEAANAPKRTARLKFWKAS